MRNYFRILRFARPYRKQILLSVIFNLLVVLFSLGSITILIPVLKILFENTQQQPQPLPFQGLLQLREYLESQLNYHIVRWSGQIGAQRVLLYILGVATLLFILKNACRYLGGVFLAFIKNGVERDLRTSIHAKVLDLPLAFFTEKHKGDIVARLTTDITEIQWAFMSSIQRMIQDPLMILSTILLLVVLSPKLTLFVVVLIPVTGFVITAVGNTLKRPSARAKEELGRILSYVEEHLGGLPIIKSYVA